MINLGKIIKDKRIAHSLAIEDVSHILKIRQEHIEAIERGDAEHFGAKAYYLGYLKQYLKLLQIEDIDLNSASIDQNQKLEINIPASDIFNPNILFSILALICGLLIYKISDNYISKEAISPIALEIESQNTKFVELN